MRRTEHMVPCRDGVRLATDVYLPPEGSGPFPVILERTPYGKREVSRSERTAADPVPVRREEVAAYFNAHGYAVVYQDCRGRWGSEGEFVKYLADGEDGYDCCAWMVAQPWCGPIGTMGLSYAAHTQASLGCIDPPGLAAQVLDSGGFSDAWNGGIRRGGAFELKQATWAFNQGRLAPDTVADPVRAAAFAAEDLAAWFTRWPWKPGHSPVCHAPDYEAYLFEQWRSGPFDEYWQKLGLYAKGWHGCYAPVPTVHMSSWYDPYPRTATENYMGLRDAGRGPASLILGPWTHGDRSQTAFGEVEFGPDATIDSWAGDWRAYRLRFFDRHLKGVAGLAEPPVRVFVMGGGSGRRTAEGKLDHGGHWRTAADWPLPGTRFTPFFLGRDGVLSDAPPPADAPPIAWTSDPANPVPTVGGAITSMEPLLSGGGYDQRERPGFFGHKPPFLPLASRPDVLVFQTAPLPADMEVTGPVVATLWVASDAPDTDVTAKLIDVHPPSPDYPQGFALNLCEGILRLRYRTDRAHPAMLVPGVPVRVEVELFPTANLFRTGHRIRLDVAGSEFPHYDLNPQTGEPEGAWTRMRLATNTLFVDAERASFVTLPVQPATTR